MSGWELTFFVLSVVMPLVLIVAFVWHRQWKRDPKKFADGFRRGPSQAGPNHWWRPR